jgi:uncharacterized membrane protein YsdA (DUF1294 family)
LCTHISILVGWSNFDFKNISKTQLLKTTKGQRKQSLLYKKFIFPFVPLKLPVNTGFKKETLVLNKKQSCFIYSLSISSEIRNIFSQSTLMEVYLIYVFYLILLANVLSYILMIIDKRKAIKGKWRIPERQLFIAAWLAGSIGIWLGMLPPVNHKKSKSAFIWKLAAITVVQVFLVYMVRR